MRATWSGMISFGLVNIPVKAFTAARNRDISFHQLHKEDSGRVGYDKVCKVCGNSLDKDDIVKGYEYRKGQYVIVTDEDLDSINLETTKTISILHFVDTNEINPLLYDQSYYIAPDENGARAYALLREALEKSNKVGIGKVTFRAREQLAALRVVEGALVLETLHLADEMVDTGEMGIPAEDVQVPANELELADVLIQHLTAPFKPEEYHDEYEQALKGLIDKKIEGEEVTAPPTPQPTNVIDIMSALKASLEAAESGDGAKRKTA